MNRVSTRSNTIITLHIKFVIDATGQEYLGSCVQY